MHTSPVSKCAVSSVREQLEFYKELGYDGIFITNHFLDGNINIESTMSYEEKVDFYFSDYEEAAALADEIGIKVFCGVDKAWYLAHPEIMDMKKSAELPMMMDSGALVIQAHPFREASYIDHIRLFPRVVHGVEIVNACRTDAENAMAKVYAESYGLLAFAGSDNHKAATPKRLAGMCSTDAIADEQDFIERVKSGAMQTFSLEV